MALGLLSVALMILDARQGRLQQLRAVLGVVVLPIQYVVDLPVTAARWVRDSLGTRQTLVEENASLRAQRLLLEAQMTRYAALEAENARLRDLLGSSLQVGDRVLIAELLTVDMDPYRQLVTLNKGAQQGVYVGQTLLDSGGIMGQVIQVGPLSSTGMLISDPGHAIPVQILRTGLRTIALGTGSASRLDLPYLANTVDVRPDDLLVTSGLGGRFPPGYPVGTVVSVSPDPGSGFARVAAVPTAQLERSREVLLVWRQDAATAAGAPKQ